ncbi:hypothetical protein AU14_13015 [Marinobacter similis]|uniref:Uncharacterized protein n=1 Tax=Marinobacter similis TaxID=1420916 RepID=W5YM20_9GAMM|nr:hypothetical protein AU14_13015 [Marinobacter similis]
MIGSAGLEGNEIMEQIELEIMALGKGDLAQLVSLTTFVHQSYLSGAIFGIYRQAFFNKAAIEITPLTGTSLDGVAQVIVLAVIEDIALGRLLGQVVGKLAVTRGCTADFHCTRHHPYGFTRPDGQDQSGAVIGIALLHAPGDLRLVVTQCPQGLARLVDRRRRIPPQIRSVTSLNLADKGFSVGFECRKVALDFDLDLLSPTGQWQPQDQKC